MILHTVVLLAISTLPTALASNVLFCQIVATKSHRIIALPFLRQLAENGHNVTMISPFPPALEGVDNLHEIQHGFNEMEEQHNQFQTSSLFGEMNKYSHLLPRLAKTAYSTQWFSDLWHRRQDFDLIIIDGAFNDLCLPFLDRTTAPLVYVDTPGLVVPHHATLGQIHNPATVSYLVTPLSISSVWGRLLNVFFYVTGFPVWSFVVIRPTENEVRKIHPQVQSFSELEKDRLSLILTNSHHALDGPVPLLPNVVEIACCHCQPPRELPRDIGDFIADTDDTGIVYISLGSHVKSSNIPRETLNSILRALEKLPYKVLWKFDEGEKEQFPENVMTQKWFPQQDILGHRNTKVFVTQGGLLSVHEAKYHGIPLVVLPLYGDQPRNAWAVDEAGYGVHLPWGEVTEESFRESILEVASNPEYRRRISQISQLVQDQPDSPKEKAVWWLEYLLRNKGAAHLNQESFARTLSWPQILLLDVLLLAVCIIGLLGLVLWFGFKRIHHSVKSKVD
ncbi:UDP-glycosyltransferase UGT5-like [Penaeus japonicus]|uniref:UDP-glycosyltransferase UGT5-like n=1 Tax=Penaeus japonicus TaxID=27405 RepID=UPI001C712DF6|nr:UDP-glycosyltransferase UGT5-like [Penaeus japonicus]XP_042875318.1 UDP-glycosyltransferase UGT5-like [Penaeus japonicus]